MGSCLLELPHVSSSTLTSPCGTGYRRGGQQGRSLWELGSLGRGEGSGCSLQQHWAAGLRDYTWAVRSGGARGAVGAVPAKSSWAVEGTNLKDGWKLELVCLECESPPEISPMAVLREEATAAVGEETRRELGASTRCRPASHCPVSSGCIRGCGFILWERKCGPALEVVELAEFLKEASGNLESKHWMSLLNYKGKAGGNAFFKNVFS